MLDDDTRATKSAFDELLRRARRKGGRLVSHRLVVSAGIYKPWSPELRGLSSGRMVNLIGVGLVSVRVMCPDHAHVRFFNYGEPIPDGVPLNVLRSLFTGPDGRPCSHRIDY